jgi:hypothetical protein
VRKKNCVRWRRRGWPGRPPISCARSWRHSNPSHSDSHAANRGKPRAPVCSCLCCSRRMPGKPPSSHRPCAPCCAPSDPPAGAAGGTSTAPPPFSRVLLCPVWPRISAASVSGRAGGRPLTTTPEGGIAAVGVVSWPSLTHPLGEFDPPAFLAGSLLGHTVLSPLGPRTRPGPGPSRIVSRSRLGCRLLVLHR